MQPEMSVVRTHALAEIDKHARYFRIAIFGFVGSYSIVIMAILALGAHVSRVGQRILRALESADMGR